MLLYTFLTISYFPPFLSILTLTLLRHFLLFHPSSLFCTFLQSSEILTKPCSPLISPSQCHSTTFSASSFWLFFPTSSPSFASLMFFFSSLLIPLSMQEPYLQSVCECCSYRLDPDNPVRFLSLQCENGENEPVVLPVIHSCECTSCQGGD